MLMLFNFDLMQATMTRRKKIVVLALLTFAALC
jgi:hypothetical protein